ncbi:hypothetical protein BJV77DRAFT_87984 [Russula vinacea]|nr:hypothetical protein BJV77DRAFT_87984 [Russula vinacea]
MPAGHAPSSIVTIDLSIIDPRCSFHPPCALTGTLFLREDGYSFLPSIFLIREKGKIRLFPGEPPPRDAEGKRGQKIYLPLATSLFSSSLLPSDTSVSPHSDPFIAHHNHFQSVAASAPGERTPSWAISPKVPPIKTRHRTTLNLLASTS